MFSHARRYADCFGALEAAVVKYDALPYDEPAGYLMSPRQTLGALLTERGEHAKAVAVYEADLEAFPKNVWALAGLKQCLVALGDDGSGVLRARKDAVEAALAAAAAAADVRVCASCACALESWQA